MTTPNQSPGSELEKAIGIGAFQLGGGTYNYGQDLTEAVAKTLILGPAGSIMSGIDDIATAIHRVAQYLLTLPLETLQYLEEFIPGTTAEDFETVNKAVDTIMGALGQVELMLYSVWQSFLDLASGLTNADVMDFVGKLVNLNLDGTFDASQLVNVANIPKLAMSAIDGLVDALANIGEDLAQGIIDGVIQVFGGSGTGHTIQDLKNAFGSIPQAVVEGLDTALNSLSSSVNSVSDWIQQVIDAIISAIRKVPIVGGSIADIISDIGGLKDQADQTSDSTTAIQSGIVEGWAGGTAIGADQDVYDTMASIRALVGGDGYTRAVITATTTWVKPTGVTEIVLIGFAAGENGASGTLDGPGGAGGRGGGHVVYAIDPVAISTIDITVGMSNGAPTVFRVGVPGNPHTGAVITQANNAASGGMATMFGYAPSSSGAANGGAGGAPAPNSGSNGSPGQAGYSSVAGQGGAGGAGGVTGSNAGNAEGKLGGPGASISIGASVPCGGGGGGGGGGGAFHTSFLSVPQKGGNGGPGGFPGGGGGGGGSYPAGGGGSSGAGGVGAAGAAIVFYR